ncbi:MAG: hypothetical protein U0P45_17370, partial [Acidimicrobiales bacterium]
MALAPQVRGVTDDADRGLVGADGAVGAQPVEHRRRHVVGLDVLEVVERERQPGDIVLDAHREPAARLAGGQLGEHGPSHRRGEGLGRQPVAATDDPRQGGEAARRHRLHERCGHVHQEGLANAARLLRAVEHGHGGDGGREGLDQVLDGERPVQADLDDADLLAGSLEALHRLVGALCARAHHHHHPLGVGGTHVVEQPVAPTGERAEPVHRPFHHARAGVVERVGGLSRLEEGVGVGRGSPHDRSLRREPPGTVARHGIDGDQLPQDLVAHHLELLDLVAGAEPVEEVQEGHPRIEGRGMGDGRQVLRLLRRAGGQEGEARLADGHHVGVVTEDRQRMGGHGASRHVEAERGQLAGDLVQVRDHQQEPLRCRDAGRQTAGLERSVQGARRTAFRLHLGHDGHRAPQVGPACR